MTKWRMCNKTRNPRFLIRHIMSKSVQKCIQSRGMECGLLCQILQAIQEMIFEQLLGWGSNRDTLPSPSGHFTHFDRKMSDLHLQSCCDHSRLPANLWMTWILLFLVWSASLCMPLSGYQTLSNSQAWSSRVG